MPESLLRSLLTFLLKALFRVRVRGLEHFHAAGERVIVIANHQSFLDPLLLAVFLPQKPAFAMNEFQARKWYFRPLIKLVEVFRIDPSQPMTTKSVIARLKEKGTVVIFPEGRITTTGGIMKIYDGTGLILDKTNATVLPIHIEGAQFTYLSLLGGKVKRRLFPRITLTFFPPRKMELPADLPGKERREHAAQWIYDLMTENMFRANFRAMPVLSQIADSGARYGYGMKIAEDINREAQSYRKLFTRCFALAGALQPKLGKAENVAVLLPTSLAGMVTFLALHALKRVPAMLNFSAGERNLRLACQMALADTLITSRSFIDKGKLQPLIDALSPEMKIVYLEDARSSITLSAKIKARAIAQFPRLSAAHFTHGIDPHATAAILYTSGSEGTPKGVCLSHANLLANIHQAAARLSFTNRDVLFNALPIFHSFGLTIGTLLPLTLGIRVFLYPSPLHYRIVPELAYDVNATILLGTDTFFRGYATYAHPYDFQSIRLAVAGAEKLKPETRALWSERFRVNILEGYGVTEASPAISFNTPIEHKTGSVGRPFPCIQCRLEPVPGLPRGGKLLVKGPNVMLGYLRADNPGVLDNASEWYDTGDIVELDEDGFILIQGRAKRFAKIGGEMVSLAAVEELAARHWPEHGHAAIAISDARKGEQIILITECATLKREDLLSRAQGEGMPEISIPKRILEMSALPRLGSGKIDYVMLKEEIERLTPAESPAA